MNNLLKKIFNAKASFNAIKKSADNPYFKSKYADLPSILEEVEEKLYNEGLIILQPTVHIGDKNFVETRIVDTETGCSISSFTEILFVQNNAQSQGSGITYARRYGLQSLLCLSVVDDDGNLATGNQIIGAKTQPMNPTITSNTMVNGMSVLTIAKKEADEATSIAELKKVWEKYPHLQNEKEFSDHITLKKTNL